jgi:hypothetical protein
MKVGDDGDDCGQERQEINRSHHHPNCSRTIDVASPVMLSNIER